MHVPRAVEEDPFVRGHRRVGAQQVLEHRGADTFGMRSLGDLGELERIAQQDDVARGRALDGFTVVRFTPEVRPTPGATRSLLVGPE